MKYHFLTIESFVFGKINTLLSNYFSGKNHFVSKIPAKYKFIRKTQAINFRSNSMVGVYLNKKKEKVVIKQYAYKLKDLDYKYLVNEASVLKLFNTIKLIPNNKVKIRFPNLIEVCSDKHNIMLVTEFVSGVALSNLSSQQIVKHIILVIKYFRSLSQILPKNEFNALPKRSPYLMLLTFPFYLLRTFIKEPYHIRNYFYCVYYFYKYSKYAVLNNKFGVAHRDLYPDNIIIDKKSGDITIIDPECLVVSDELYDLASLARLYSRFLTPIDIIIIINALELDYREKQKLICLMISGCMIKIATEKKATRDYNDAISGLQTVINNLIPKLNENIYDIYDNRIYSNG